MNRRVLPLIIGSLLLSLVCGSSSGRASYGRVYGGGGTRKSPTSASTITTTRGARHERQDGHPHRSEVAVFLFRRPWSRARIVCA